MNNLKPQITERIVSSDLLSQIKSMTIDTDLNHIYCVNHLNQLISIDINNFSIKKCCDVFPVDNDFECICVQFLSEERSVCIVSTSGDISVFNTMTETLETVGSLSDGLESIGFSLDQELIVLLTKNYSLILMNKLFDVLTQKDLKTEEFGCNPSVSVNWGSKLTQFHGEGKRDVRAQQKNFKSFSDFDDKKSRISWRADGLYFMTSFYDFNSNYRKLQIWSREGVLQYTGERISGLEHPIAWKPSGALIASSQMLPNKHLVVFIEKNGLKHGEFELPFAPNTFKIQVILWSNDSQILLILGTKTETQISEQFLMLWRQTNYKWDLKQCLRFKENTIENVIWDPIDATLLHLTLSDGNYSRYRWKWSVDSSEGNICVIDGKSLKLTNFALSAIPPPFYSYCFNFESEIVQMCFSKTKLAVILSDDTVFIFNTSSKNTKNESEKHFTLTFDNFNEEKEEIFEYLSSNKCENISHLTNIVVDENGVLFGDRSKQLFCFDFQSDTKSLNKIFDLLFNVLAINCLENILGIVSNDNNLWKADLKNKTITEWVDRNDKRVSFPTQSSELKLFKIGENISAFCLTENSSLCADNDILSQNNCNSFVKYKDSFLLFTTTDHFLHSWPLNDNIFESNKNYQQFRPRSVERGSKLIAVTTDGKTILQMPRGNIEAIYPRLLLLDLIKMHLDKVEYDYAFDLLRRHRINLNIIYDYKPRDFRSYIKYFIEKISNKNIDWISLFVNDLSNEDFYAKMIETNEQKLNKWPNPYAVDPLPHNDFHPKTKIDLICDLLREKMDKIDSNKYLNPILLCYVKKSEPEIVNALNRIKSIEETVVREKAIKFLLYSININTLLDEALGSYDSNLFLMVASKSQKDPKEYLALLEQFNRYESFDYRCYQIDVHLKRYKKALNHISKCEQHFDECLDLIRKHSLYSEAVLLFDKSCEEKYNRIWKSYAEYLFDKKYFEESAIAFKRSNDFVNAVKAYQLSGNWSAGIDCAIRSSNLVNIETLSRNFAKHLVSIGQHFEASYLLQTYANDINQSISVLIDGHEWEHALRLIATTNSEDLMDQFRTELKRHYESIAVLIRTNHYVLLFRINRLETVRQMQSQKTVEFKGFDNFDDKSEIYSETNSMTESNQSSQKSSSSSLATKKSRKSTKKSEKRKYILKIGSSDEDIQLIFTIKEIILNSDKLQEEVALLVKTLFNFDYFEESKKLQKDFTILLDLIQKVIEEIWSQNQTEESTIKYRLNDPELAKAPELRKIDWKLALV